MFILVRFLGDVQICGHPGQFQFVLLARPGGREEKREGQGGTRAWQLNMPAPGGALWEGGPTPGAAGSHSTSRSTAAEGGSPNLSRQFLLDLESV